MSSPFTLPTFYEDESDEDTQFPFPSNTIQKALETDSEFIVIDSKSRYLFYSFYLK